MEKTSGTSRRDEGGGGSGGSSGGNKGGKKSDDDEDVAGGIVNRARRWDRPMGIRARVVEKLQMGGVGLVHRHLHERQASPDAVGLDIAAVAGDANTATARDPINPSTPVPTPATRTSSNSPIDTINSQQSSNQVMLSSTPPPSPAQTGPSLSSAFPTISANSLSSISIGANSNNLSSTSTTRGSTTRRPTTTVTSYLTSSITRSRNSTISTSWSYSQTTTEETVIVYAFPTSLIRSNSTTTRSSTQNSTSTSTSSTRSTLSSTTLGLGDAGAPTIASVPSTTAPSQTAEASGGGPNVNPMIIGAVLGSIAGLGLILFAILMLLRRHKRNMEIQRRVDAGYGGPAVGSSTGGGTMVERSSDTPFAGAAAAFFRRSRQSQVSEPASEEKGFYKVAGTGRKLPPVIGGPRPDPNTSSFYQDDDGRWVGGPGTPVSSADAGGPSRYSGFTATTASPTSTAPASSISPIGIAISPPGTAISPTPFGATAITGERHSRIQEEFDEVDSERETTPVMPRPPGFGSNPNLAGRDGLGRSLPSHDGSRASRFTEDIV